LRRRGDRRLMLFSSFVFIFAFLPLSLAVTYGAGRFHSLAWLARLSLTLLSLGFYAWWRPEHLPILLVSIGFNFVMGDLIQRAVEGERRRWATAWLVFGLAGDLALLGWFKYANFVDENLALLTGGRPRLDPIILPLAISFFTFQKIAYLVDSFRGQARKMSLLDFSLFASFFPQLLAGPIVHYKEVVPQLRSRLFGRLIWRNLLVGLVIFAIGLFKKTVLADTFAAQVNPVYKSVSEGQPLDLGGGWLAAAAFTLQVYFDFSGYSDMAIGSARMLGVKLPLNFHSPLRASNIIDYWRRWHMTLQRFIVSYLFQPLSLSLNRAVAGWGLRGWTVFALGVGVPTFITFVAVGIWHGAGWTFVVFGVMHAVYLCANEAWREARNRRRRALRKLGRTLPEAGAVSRVAAYLLTMTAVVFANVMFRAKSVDDAVSIWSAMVGLNGASSASVITPAIVASLIAGAAIVFLAPNTQQIMGRFDPAFNWREWRGVATAPLQWTWKPNAAGLLFASAVFLTGVLFIQRGKAVFLYFNF
jgi:alginate O-acetyltransferase complex protein AlgI